MVATHTEAASLDRGDVISLKKNPDVENPWAGLFVFYSTCQEYNEERLRREDPQGHRWCSDKQIFDYTPYVTREDWVLRFLQQRRIVCRDNAAGPWRPAHLYLEKEAWRPLLGETPVLRARPARERDLLKIGRAHV